MVVTALSQGRKGRILTFGHLTNSPMKTAALFLALFCILALAIGGASYTWFGIGDSGMSASGYVALAIGVVFSLIVGCGLMALMFYSNRRGHDEPPKLGD